MQEPTADLNPWISMWTQPRKTIRAVINTNPKMGFYFLSSIWFLQFFFLFESYYSIQFPIHWAITLIIAVILSPFLGAIMFYVFGWFLYIIGKGLNGEASYSHNRCAFAWSRLPDIIDLIIWFALSAFLSELIFARVGVGISFIFINIIAALTTIWAFVLLVGTVREIQGFSVMRAFVNVVSVYVIKYFILFVLSLAFYKIIFN